MSGPTLPPAAAAGRMDVGTTILVGALGTVLVAGFVVLSAIGRDTTSYLLFLGGPAVTAIVGGLVNRRVTTAAAAVVATQTETHALVSESVAELDDHLAQQDQTIGEIHAGVVGDPAPTATPPRGFPAARDNRSSGGPLSLPQRTQAGRHE